MHDSLTRLWAAGAAATLSAAALAGMTAAVGGAPPEAVAGAARAAGGILAGGIWNLANFWCLSRLLATWLGAPRLSAGQAAPHRSNRRVLFWLLVKFPLLYTAAFLALRHQTVSLVGFGIGFTVVLLTAMVVLGSSAWQTIRVRSHGA